MNSQNHAETADSTSSMTVSSIEQADKIETIFKAVQGKFDILEHLDRHGDVNDPVFLRAELQRNSFLLAHERISSDRRSVKFNQLVDAQKKKRGETQSLVAQVKDLTERLKYVQSQLYDIVSEPDSSSFDSDCEGINLDEIS